MLSDENLVDKENMVDVNPNDAIDGDCFVHCPPLSKTKGRPKQKRMKGGKELGKQKRTCGFCKHVGHSISTCPKEGKGKLDFLKWCKENAKLYFNRYGIEPNILFEMLGLLLKKSPI